MKFTIKRASDHSYDDDNPETIDINCVEELMELADRYKKSLIIDRPNIFNLLPRILIYDAFVE